MDDDKKPDSHVAYGAAMDGVAAIAASVSIVGRYWWNRQMQLLQKIGLMPLFKAHWWLFLVVGFLLLAFLFPLGIAFIVSSWSAGQMDPKAANDFIVPLRQEPHDIGSSANLGDDQADSTPPFRHGLDDDKRSDVYDAAGISHVNFLRALEREVDDAEFAAAALGAFDGTIQVFELSLNDFEMMTMGAAFIVRQLKELGRLNEIDPARIADLTAEAMHSDALEDIRGQAGQVAYSMHMALQQ